MSKPQSDGFTLIELMIVVAIIGILAAVAVPSFIRFQLRTKAAEVKAMLPAIQTAEGSYFAEFGTYIQIAPTPPGAVATGKRAWPLCPAVIVLAASPGECIIGYQPEGPTYYSFAVATVNANGAPLRNTEFFGDAQSDIDGDGVPNLWGLRQPAGTGVATIVPGAQGCPDVIDGATGSPMLGTIGPCGPGYGHTIF